MDRRLVPAKGKLTYWPQAGVVVGLLVTMSAVFVPPELAAKLGVLGTNILTGSALYAAKQRAKRRE